MHLTKRESFAIGACTMVLSGAMLAFIGFFAQLGAQDLSISSLIFYRFLLSSLFGTLACFIIGKGREIFQFSQMGLQLLRTFFLMVAQYSFFYYATHNTLLNAIVLLNTGPLFISLIEWGVFRQPVGKSTWIALAVSFIGVVLVLQPDQGIFSWMSGIGLMAGIGQGASQAIFGHTSREKTPAVGVVHLMWLCVAASFIPYLFFNWGQPSPFRPERDGLLLLGLGLVSLINQWTRASAYQHASPARLAVFLYFSVIVAALLDLYFYHVLPGVLSCIGAGLVVLGGVLKVVLRSYFLRRKTPL